MTKEHRDEIWRNSGPIANGEAYCEHCHLKPGDSDYQLAMKYDGRLLHSLTADEMAEIWEDNHWLDRQLAVLFNCKVSHVTSVRKKLGIGIRSEFLHKYEKTARFYMSDADAAEHTAEMAKVVDLVFGKKKSLATN